MRPRQISRRLIVLAALCSLAACGGRGTIMSAKDEAQIGAREHPKIVEFYGGAVDNPKLTAYVEGVLARVAATSDKPEAQYRITVLDSPVVNAFALPGGYTYVTRGLLALAKTEAELAGVIGHEIAHVTARHGAKRHTASVGTAVVAGVLGAALKIGVGVDPKVTGDLVSLGGSALLAGYSRENEYEADNLGIGAMARAGYDPQGQADLLEALGRYGDWQSGGKKGSEWFATHPNNADRVKKAREKARARTTPTSTRVGRDAHLDAIDGMAFGDQAAQGVVRGRTFEHADLRMAFTVPKGFEIENAATRVTARHANGVQIVFDLDQRIANEPVDDYLTGSWGAGTTVQGLKTLKVAGRAAAAGAVTTEDGVAHLLAIDGGIASFLRFGVLAPAAQKAAAETAMRSLQRQVRFLSAAEAAAIKPLKLKIITIEKGDTVYSLSQLMRTDKAQRQKLFRILNGLADNDNELAVGRRIKLVAD